MDTYINFFFFFNVSRFFFSQKQGGAIAPPLPLCGSAPARITFFSDVKKLEMFYLALPM